MDLTELISQTPQQPKARPLKGAEQGGESVPDDAFDAAVSAEVQPKAPPKLQPEASVIALSGEGAVPGESPQPKLLAGLPDLAARPPSKGTIEVVEGSVSREIAVSKPVLEMKPDLARGHTEATVDPVVLKAGLAAKIEQSADQTISKDPRQVAAPIINKSDAVVATPRTPDQSLVQSTPIVTARALVTSEARPKSDLMGPRKPQPMAPPLTSSMVAASATTSDGTGVSPANEHAPLQSEAKNPAVPQRQITDPITQQRQREPITAKQEAATPVRPQGLPTEIRRASNSSSATEVRAAETPDFKTSVSDTENNLKQSDVWTKAFPEHQRDLGAINKVSVNNSIGFKASGKSLAESGLANPAQISNQIVTVENQAAPTARFEPFVAERAVAHQIAAAARTRANGGVIEVVLDPPELGRIEIAMEIGEQGIRAVLSAERATTNDLLRRHSDLLAEQFEDAGFSDVDLGFSENFEESRGEEDRGGGMPLTEINQGTETPDDNGQRRTNANGLVDLRL